ncbi:GH-E family nuclease [Fibrella arboris]|uniref:GH-E family nuclease n=1 Tax=Fibrella arboris TaxID=3242486 RepID=UPI003521185C
MFVIRQSQLDAFRLPHREKIRQQAMAGLRSDGFDVEQLPDGHSFVATDERGAQTRLIYTDRILPETVRQPLGDEYHLSYTKNGQLSGIDYPGGEQLQLSRTPEGLITRLQTAPEQAFSLNYKESILKRVTYPGGAFRQFEHNASGLLTHLTDRTGHTRQYIRDELTGQLIGLVDPLNRTTHFTFDEGYLTGVIYADGSRQTVAYDEEDETLYVSLRDGKGFIQHYNGESLRELIWQDGPWVRFTQDADGRPLSIRTPDSQLTFGYAGHGLAAEQGILGTSQLVYQDNGQLTQVRLATGLVVGYGYDLNGRLSYIDAGDQRIQYEYGPNGLLLNTNYPNGLGQQEIQQHLGGLQQTRLTDKLGKVLAEQRYTYDAEQRLTGIEEAVSGQLCTLTYDAESRLLSVADRQTGQVREQFSYDAAGTLQQLNGWPVRSGPMGEIRAVGPDVWQYDALGNATSLRGPKGPMQLEFARNSTLSSLTINSQRWQYTYDGLGRRISKTDGQVRWQYAWLEGRLLAETYQPTPQANPVVRQYVYHPDTYTPVAFLEGEQLYTLHTDSRGAVTHAFDSRGVLVWQGEYSAFGNCREVVAYVRQPLRLAGQYADDESGLYYNVGRYYAPFVGQYISLDPQWLEQLDTYTYAYARQDPYGRHDPLGDFGPLLIIGGAALVGGLINAGVTAYQGGSWRQVGASFVHGALSGAGAAVGAMVGGIPGLMAGAAAGGFLGTLAEQAINGEPLSIVCALQAAAIEGLLAGTFGLAGKLLGPVLGRLGRAVAQSRIGQAIGRIFRKSSPNTPISGIKPYAKSRPTYGKNQVDDTFENARQPDGKVYDPNTGEEISWDKSRSRNGQWDMGHKPGREYRKLHKDYIDGKITKDEFLNIYRDPRNYQPELPKNNRSHKYEQD